MHFGCRGLVEGPRRSIFVGPTMMDGAEGPCWAETLLKIGGTIYHADFQFLSDCHGTTPPPNCRTRKRSETTSLKQRQEDEQNVAIRTWPRVASNVTRQQLSERRVKTELCPPAKPRKQVCGSPRGTTHRIAIVGCLPSAIGQ